MNKFANNPSDLSILSEYTNYASRMLDLEKKFKAIENQNLSNEELKYYSEDSLRCSNKLLQALS